MIACRAQYLIVFLIATWLPVQVFALERLKFRHWFARYKNEWLEASQSCQSEIDHYWANNRTLHWSTCAAVADCILENTSETIKANMQSGSVLLALMPALLAQLGPSVGEIALLSTKQPLFALFLCLGSPTIRLGSHTPHLRPRSQNHRSATTVALHKWTAKQALHVRRLGPWAFYLLVLALITNIIHVTVDTDLKSVSGWRCGQMFMPVMWALSVILIHAVGIVAIHRRKVETPPNEVPMSRVPDPVVNSNLTNLPRDMKRPRCWFSQKPEEDWIRLAEARDGVLGEFLLWLTSGLIMVHTIFGVMVFASLLFVSHLDALVITGRLVLSTAICQGILLFHLENMRLEIEATCGRIRRHATFP